MPVITRLELENAQRDVTDLGKVVNGAADLPNPGKPAGTVTTRQGALVKTLSRLVADGTATVEALLTPLVYETSAVMEADATATVPGGAFKIKAGQTCYNRETTNIYILTSTTTGSTTTRVWEQVSDLAKSASAASEELLLRASVIGRLSVDDYEFMRKYDRFFEKDAARRMFIKWPGKPTTGEGLAKALTAGATSWPSKPWGQEGVDFGVPNELLGSLVAGNSHPAWTTPARILIKSNSANKNVIGYNVQGIITINSSVVDTVYIRHSIVDSNYTALTGIQQENTAPIHVDKCIIRNVIAQGHNIVNGTFQNCLIENTKGDGMKGDFLYGGVIYNCLVRRLGQIDPSAHADAIQCQKSNNLRIIGNTLYMPGTGTTYDEGTYGSTQCLRVVTENNTSSHLNFLALGNLLIGGGFTLAVRSRFNNGETSKLENVIIANNVFGGPSYHVYGHISSEHGKSTGSVGIIRNLLLHNNFDIAGNPIHIANNNQNGLWHYSKEHASALFIELGKRWGYLDWNGDPYPGIANRTEVNQPPGNPPL